MIKDDLPWSVPGSFSEEKAMIGGLSGWVGSPFSLVSSHTCFPFFESTSPGCSLDTTLNCGIRGIFVSASVGNLGETSMEEFEVGLGDLETVITSLSLVGDVGMLLGDVDNRCFVTELGLN